MKCFTMFVALMAYLAGIGIAAESGVLESARDIPVAATADVVIVGGSTGAVAAAVEAAKGGAKVFLAAPRTYLGEDMAGTLRLGLLAGEKPDGLAAALYADPHLGDTASLPFRYTADQPTGAKHKDTDPPSLLARAGIPRDVQKDTVQYDADVTITADLQASRAIDEIGLWSFARRGDFEVGEVRVETSADGKAWKACGSFKPKGEDSAVTITMPIRDTARFVRLHVIRAAGAQRLLLGALKIVPSADTTATPTAVVPRPLHVKKTLENALVAAKVEFLFGCYATELLVDRDGRPAGVVICNRAGRQAVVAKVIVDATEQATIARLAGARFVKRTPSPQTATWTVIAAEATEGHGLKVRELPWPVKVYDATGKGPTKQKALWFEYTLETAAADNSWPAQVRLEQEVRERTYNATQLYAADTPWSVPGEQLAGTQPAADAWPGAAALDLGVLKPAGVERVWLLSGCAGVPMVQAEALMRPVALTAVGARLGTLVAAEAKRLPEPQNVRVATTQPAAAERAAARCDVKELLAGLRPVAAPARVPQSAHALPVLGRYDVVVVGGGTSGAPAGIAAARQGAKTLVVEYLHGLGGVGTLGMIDKYWYGHRQGFTATVPQNPLEVRMEFYRQALREAKADIWFGTMGCGTLVDGQRVVGAVVATPFGRGIVLATVVIDATGNAELAAAAGAPTAFVEDNFVVQQSHMPPRQVGSYYINGNIEPVDVADPLDVRATVMRLADRTFDRSPLVDSRERQRIVGEYTLDWLDQINRRTFPDTIVLAASDYDSHGAQVHPYFMLKPSRPPGDHARRFYSFVPYRCLLPKKLDGLLVVGLGVSAHRDALPIIRMQPDLHNLGYAAGVAAAMAVKGGIAPRQIEVKLLQQHLVDVGNVPASVLTDRDSYPLAEEKVRAAVKKLVQDYEGLEVVLAQPEATLPLVRAAYGSAGKAEKLAYAHVLGVMGDATGLETLVAEAERRLKDESLLQLPEKGQMDDALRLIWALGGTNDRKAVPALVGLTDKLGAAGSHRLRALCVSLGRLGDPVAAPALAKLLAETKSGSWQEAVAAVALCRCRDHDGQGRQALERIAQGSNGPLARLAWQVLSEPSKQPK